MTTKSNIPLLQCCALAVLMSVSIISNASVSAPTEVASLIPTDAMVIDYRVADLNADGREDAIVVVEKSNENNTFAHSPRTIIILLRKENGELEIAESNSRAYLCKRCLGSGSFAEQSLTASKGSFSVFNQGGSPRYRWTKEYSFQYNSVDKIWILSTVKTSIIDANNNNERSKTKLLVYPKNLKKIKFSQFIPNTNWDSKF